MRHSHCYDRSGNTRRLQRRRTRSERTVSVGGTANYVRLIGLMLATVIPTVLTNSGVVYWFRSSSSGARYLPDFKLFGSP